MFKSFLEFYTKYFAWAVVVSSFLAIIFSVIYVDIDSMYYAEINESLANVWDNSPEEFLGLSNIRLAILLIVLFLFLFLAVSSYFDFIKNVAVLFVSSFLIKTWLVCFTANTVILNIGFIKILKGMTEAEKQSFIDSLRNNLIQHFEELPLEIQKITGPDIFKETTLNYLNSLKNVIPVEPVVTADILSTFSSYLWDNKVSIMLGILNIIVLSLLNDKINKVNSGLNSYAKNSNDVHTSIAESTQSLSDACQATALALSKTNAAVEGVQESIDTITNSLVVKLNNFNVLSDNSLDCSLINFVMILLKIIIKKKKI